MSHNLAGIYKPEEHKKEEKPISKWDKSKKYIKPVIGGAALAGGSYLAKKHGHKVVKGVKNAGQSAYDWAMTKLFDSVLGAYGFE
jgi:hypothetical protein